VGRPVKGDVAVTPFPFSDLSSSKRRPALVVARLTGDDIVFYTAGKVVEEKLQEVTSKIVEILQA